MRNDQNKPNQRPQRPEDQSGRGASRPDQQRPGQNQPGRGASRPDQRPGQGQYGENQPGQKDQQKKPFNK